MNYKIKKGVAVLAVGTLLTFSITGCTLFGSNTSTNTTSNSTTAEAVDLNNLFTDRDLDASYDAASPKITLANGSITSDSSNATVSGNTVTIKAAGTYILTGTSSDAQIVIDVADSDKVQLVLDNVNLTSTSATALYVKSADKVFITQAEGSNNSITINSDSTEEDGKSIDGAIYAKDDITFNGNGTLNITSTKTNGIVGNDDVKLVSGTINITSAKHGVDANDSISVKDANITVNADKDGLHCDGNVNVVGGNINIAKSNEGIEGQVINIAGGNTNVVATDDATNASSPDVNTSEDPMAVDSAAQLNISGGKLTVNANGDGLDSNGSINISGGETYVSGSTDDGNTAIDFGSECVITGGTLIAAGSSGMIEAMSDKSTQAVMTVNASSNSGTISVADSTGNVLASYTPEKTYAAVTISAPGLTVGQTYKVTCGSTSEDVTLSSTVTSNVTSQMGGMKGGGSGGMGQMQGGQGRMQGNTENGNSGQMQAPPDMNNSDGSMPTPPDMNNSNGSMPTPSDNGQMPNGNMKQGKGQMKNQ